MRVNYRRSLTGPNIFYDFFIFEIIRFCHRKFTMKGKKTVQFDRSVDIQKDEMRRERAAKEAERIRRTIEDSRTNAVLRSANDPPAFQTIPQVRF